jgi:hypothetical protein
MQAALTQLLSEVAMWGLVAGLVGLVPTVGQADETKVPLVFSGGHDYDRKKDLGRPVVLIAAALGVEPDVFRQAFSAVTPSRNGPPSPEHARANKQLLMKVLQPHGITNDRLDEVSNFYRFQPHKGELWRTTAAQGYAIVADGQIKRFVVTQPGAGYSSLPVVTVQGMENIKLMATLGFSTDLTKNGAITAVELAYPDSPGTSK